MRPKLYIIHGFLGAGKSTFSRKLAAETGAIRLNADEYCEAHFSHEELERDWDGCFSRAVDQLWLDAVGQLKSGRDVIFDMGFWSRESRKYAEERALAAGAEYVHYYIHAPDDVLRARLAKRPPEFAEKHLAHFDKTKTFFDLPQADEKFILIENY